MVLYILCGQYCCLSTCFVSIFVLTGPAVSATPTEVLKEFVESSARTPQEIVSELRRVQLARGLDDQQKGQALIQATLDASKPKTIAQQVKANKKLLHLVGLFGFSYK